MEEMPSQRTPVQRVQVAILPLDLPCSGPVTYLGDISNTGKCHKKKTDGSSMDKKEIKKVSRFKYATWNIRGLGEKEEELYKTSNENIIKISLITESKKRKCKALKETKNYTVMYSGVKRYITGQLRVMISIHKSISHKIVYYKFWNDRIIETTMKINRGHSTILGLYAPTEGREESNEKFYKILQKVVDTVNKNAYIMLIGDMNTQVGNNIIKITNIVGTNEEASLNNNGEK
jgi:CRISPR/Cas system CSM-associated protein Csm2 small subunit